MNRNVIIDCDTGMDDAVALLLAIRSPILNVKGITYVAGNVNLDYVINNTLRVVEHSDQKVPVYAGARMPLVPQISDDASSVHGKDGLGGLPFPDPQASVQKTHAVDFIVDTIMAAEQPLDWITLGPLTNAALAYIKEPHIAENIRQLTMMAGAVETGNVLPTSEFNVYADPEAAKVVFDSSIPKTMVPLDPLYHGGLLTKDDIQIISDASQAAWCDMATRIFKRSIEINKKLGRRAVQGKDGSVTPPDLLAVAIAIDPSIANLTEYTVQVETRGLETRGMTVVDRRVYDNPGRETLKNPVRIAFSIDQRKYRDLVLDAWIK